MCPCCDYSCNACFVCRKDIAKLLGYENYAQMSMETKMAGSVENVMNMIERSVRPGVNPPSTIPNPIPVDFLIPNPIPVNLAMIPIPVIFPSAIPTPNPTPIQISSY